MEKTKLSMDELNRRCKQVFKYEDYPLYHNLYDTGNGLAHILIAEYDSLLGGYVCTAISEDLSSRPEALAYLMGLRDDFND